MERRAQKYEDESLKTNTVTSRTSKNEYLYDEINNRIGYEEIVNLDSHAKIDLSNLSNSSSREDYQKLKDYKMFMKPEETPKEEFEPTKPKEYDINVILDQARRNREKYDELEKKRKLKENSYVKIADINQKNEESRYNKPDIDEEELTNLINTITSHNLVEEIKKAENEVSGDNPEELLSDLLATSANQVVTEGIAQEYTASVSVETKIDNSFYTKSMDLSDHDFELSEEIEEENKIKSKIILIVVVIVIIVLIIAFFILKGKGIIKI